MSNTVLSDGEVNALRNLDEAVYTTMYEIGLAGHGLAVLGEAVEIANAIEAFNEKLGRTEFIANGVLISE